MERDALVAEKESFSVELWKGRDERSLSNAQVKNTHSLTHASKQASKQASNCDHTITNTTMYSQPHTHASKQASSSGHTDTNTITQL